MSGTTGPEDDDGIRQAIYKLIPGQHHIPEVWALYAAIADWHRRETAKLEEENKALRSDRGNDGNGRGSDLESWSATAGGLATSDAWSGALDGFGYL